ncbi:MmcQ/YjbR family DNA-binding protein [Caulobacter segnis]|uniref:MmcQ/YjbR family DNA-binding protein n=1 Tax=Caulobacter segnis TaxID=88688 RepID=UPI001CBB3809|nr:MmcQ/YjbR family DNA-binding protein [Caulobacter segnis]UAL11253.1 MmcQ/YjbR family DNA-binding protein [Caulobacter segnis]
MVDERQLEALALALPEVAGAVSESGQFAFEVGGKGLAWAYVARPAPKARRVLVPGVIAVRCAMETKELLLEAAPDRFFTDDHYRGYPAVLVRLSEIEADELGGLLKQAWMLVAPKPIQKRHPGV